MRQLYCSKCDKDLPEDKFSLKRNSKRGRSYRCKDCHNSYVRDKWYVDNRDKQIASSAKWREGKKAKIAAQRYKTTEEVIQSLWDKGACEICGASDDLHIDHCHKTGKVRGLLCRKCNFGIGHLEDDLDRVRSAMVYLELHS